MGAAAALYPATGWVFRSRHAVQVAEVRWYSIGVLMEELEEALDGLQNHLHDYSKHIPDAAIKLYAKPHPTPEKDLMTP